LVLLQLQESEARLEDVVLLEQDAFTGSVVAPFCRRLQRLVFARELQREATQLELDEMACRVMELEHDVQTAVVTASSSAQVGPSGQASRLSGHRDAYRGSMADSHGRSESVEDEVARLRLEADDLRAAANEAQLQSAKSARALEDMQRHLLAAREQQQQKTMRESRSSPRGTVWPQHSLQVIPHESDATAAIQASRRNQHHAQRDHLWPPYQHHQNASSPSSPGRNRSLYDEDDLDDAEGTTDAQKVNRVADRHHDNRTRVIKSAVAVNDDGGRGFMIDVAGEGTPSATPSVDVVAERAALAAARLVAEAKQQWRAEAEARHQAQLQRLVGRVVVQEEELLQLRHAVGALRATMRLS
jgi:hypothetical protein